MDNATTGSSLRGPDSVRVQLRFTTTTTLELFQFGIDVIRLTASVEFQIGTGWSEASNAILDTGMYLSVVPRYIWEDSKHLFRSGPDSLIPLGGSIATGKLGTITVRIHDGINYSPSLTLNAFLMNDDSYPLLLGFEDFLTKADLYCSYSQNIAYLEFT